MALNLKKYWKHVEDFDMTDEQKIGLLHNLAAIMESFVDSAFGIHPAQQRRGYLSQYNLQSPVKSLDSKVTRLKEAFPHTLAPYWSPN